MTHRLRVTLLLLTLLAAAAWTAQGGSLRKPMPPRLEDTDAISALAKHARAEAPEEYRSLAVFPVTVTGVSVPPVDMPLDRAVGKDLVEVLELDDSEVNRLHVVSRAREPVFAMAGEMLRGGKQDRILAADLVIPPQTKIEVAVYCVEHGRWAMDGGGGGRAGFTAGHSMAGSAVRRAGGAGGGGRGGGGQGAVWSEVEASQRRLQAPSATGALRSVHDSADVQGHISPYQHALAGLAEDHPKASGVVVVVNGEILAADVFSSPALFRQLWPQLLEAYAIDAVERDDHGKAHAPSRMRVQSWLSDGAEAHRTRRDTPGEGVRYEIRGDGVMGSALVWKSGVVHLELFPGQPEEREDDFNTLEFRRGRLSR